MLSVVEFLASVGFVFIESFDLFVLFFIMVNKRLTSVQKFLFSKNIHKPKERGVI